MTTLFVVALRMDYEGILELKGAYPTEAEADAEAVRLNYATPQNVRAEVIPVPMLGKPTDCAECGKPFATEADVDAAYTSHMDGSGICWHGKGSAYGTDGCRNAPK